MKSNRQHDGFAAGCVVLFSLLAHGYRYLTLGFSADSVQVSQANEVAYQISLGRFMQPVLWKIRGYITVPTTVGLFATGLLILSVLLVLRMLRFESRLSVALVCGILATNETLAVSNGTYLPWTDVYMLALFLSMLGVYVTQRFRFGWLFSPVLYFLSLGAYQSYLQCAVLLTLMLFIVRLLNGEKTAVIWIDGVKAIISFLLGLILYAVGTRVIMALLGITISDDYNTIAAVGQYKPGEIIPLLIKTYVDPFLYFFSPKGTMFIGLTINVPLLALAGAALVLLAKPLSRGAKATIAFLILLFPYGMNFVQFLTVWFKHTLMIYSHFFVYVFAIYLAERTLKGMSSRKIVRIGSALAALLVSLGIFRNISVSNQMSLKRDLEWQSTASAMSRLMDIIDSYPGYVPGETEVVMGGLLSSSAVSMLHPGFSEVSGIQGMYNNNAILHESAMEWYATNILNEPMRIAPATVMRSAKIREIAPDLAAFPNPDCCRMIDGTLYVRLN